MDDKPKEIIKDQPEWMLKSTVTGNVRNLYFIMGAILDSPPRIFGLFSDFVIWEIVFGLRGPPVLKC